VKITQLDQSTNSLFLEWQIFCILIFLGEILMWEITASS